MKLLKEISEKSLGISNKEILGEKYELRKSARGVLLNSKNEVCLQYVRKFNFYKLPGGGVDVGETEEEALKREILEEVGCDVVIEKPLGLIIEYRNTHDLLHLSYGYLCKVKGEITNPKYEQDEIDEGYESVWRPVAEAVDILEKHYPEEPYQARFIVTREKAFLRESQVIVT